MEGVITADLRKAEDFLGAPLQYFAQKSEYHTLSSSRGCQLLAELAQASTACTQGLLAELRKDEKTVEGVITADLRKAENFLEGIESRYRLPKWMPFRDFVFRFPWEKAEGTPLPSLPSIPGVSAQIPIPGAPEK